MRAAYLAGLFLLGLLVVIGDEACCSGGDDVDHDHHDHHDHDHDHNHDDHHDCHHHGAKRGLYDSIRAEYVKTWPWVLVGMITAVALNQIGVPMNALSAFLHSDNRESWSLSAVLLCTKAATLGLFMPLCSCGALPLAMSLQRSGVPSAAVVAFLTAAQSSGFDSAALTYGLLGARAMVGRLVGALVLAVIAGLVAPMEPSNITEDPTCCDDHEKKTDKSKKVLDDSAGSMLKGVLRAFRPFVEAFDEVAPYIVVGIAASTTMAYYLPSVVSMQSGASVLVRVAVLAFALPLQLCEHSTVSFASALQKAGATPGTAFGFLLSAPSTNLATLGAMSGGSNTVSLAWKVPVAVVLGALAISVVVDSLEYDMIVGANVAGGLSIPSWFTPLSLWVGAQLLTLSVCKRLGLSF